MAFFAIVGSGFLIVAVLPFLTGFMTGAITFVGITLPLLLRLWETACSRASLPWLSAAAGVILSPLHLCLVLTREYFGADITKVYRLLWLPSPGPGRGTGSFVFLPEDRDQA
jgi:hypothetical protein